MPLFLCSLWVGLSMPLAGGWLLQGLPHEFAAQVMPRSVRCQPPGDWAGGHDPACRRQGSQAWPWWHRGHWAVMPHAASGRAPSLHQQWLPSPWHNIPPILPLATPEQLHCCFHAPSPLQSGIYTVFSSALFKKVGSAFQPLGGRSDSDTGSSATKGHAGRL